MRLGRTLKKPGRRIVIETIIPALSNRRKLDHGHCKEEEMAAKNCS